MLSFAPGPVPIAWRRHGADEGEPVLLVMGLGMRGMVWRPQLAALGAGHPVVTFDHRGIGDTPDDPRPFELADLAADALRVADAAGFERFHLVGVSLGGMVSQHVALAAPGRIRTLSLLVTHAGGGLTWLPPLTGAWHSLRVRRARSVEARARAMADLLFTENLPADPAAWAQRVEDTAALPAKPSVLRRQLRAVSRHHTRHRLHEITAPTLVVQAARDKLIDPRHSETLARGIPNARLVRIERAGHGLLFENAEVVNRLLLEHIER